MALKAQDSPLSVKNSIIEPLKEKLVMEHVFLVLFYPAKIGQVANVQKTQCLIDSEFVPALMVLFSVGIITD